jgi:hypothetical protein
LSFFGSTDIDEQIVVLARLESLSRVRSEQLADIFTAKN